MTDYNLGRVGIVLKGAYSAQTAYKRLDLVSYEGRSYIALQDATAKVPTNTAYWQKATLNGKGYNPRGTWEALATYTNDPETIDVVSHNGVSYYCVLSHTGESVEPDLDTTNWRVLVALGNAASIALTDADEYYTATDVEGALKEAYLNLGAHKTDTMPHQLKDTKTNKTYKFGFQLSAEGNPQIIFEEVV